MDVVVGLTLFGHEHLNTDEERKSHWSLLFTLDQVFAYFINKQKLLNLREKDNFFLLHLKRFILRFFQ